MARSSRWITRYFKILYKEPKMADVKKPSKAELFAAVSAELKVVYDSKKVSKDAQESINAIVSKYMEPKASGFGKSANLDEITKRDANGKITEILCSISNKWLPATSEFFYSEKKGEGIGGTGFRRGSKPGEATLKAFKRSQFAKQQELIAKAGKGEIKQEDLAKKLQEVANAKVDFSGVNKDYFKNKAAAAASAAASKKEELIADETAKQKAKKTLNG